MDSVSFDPVASWWFVVLMGAGVTGLTLWAYSVRMKTAKGRWRWFALGLRLAAILLCVIAALRPSVVFKEKKKQPTDIVFLLDDSSSMKFLDGIGGQSRWDFARKTLDEAREVSKTLGDGVTAKFFRFDSGLRDLPDKLPDVPDGKMTGLGLAMMDSFRREGSGHVASIIVLSDGSNNFGMAPLLAAKQLKGHDVPVITVPFGSEAAGANSREIAVKSLVAAPTVFIKNKLEVKGNLQVRGFAGQTIEANLYVEGQAREIASRKIRIAPGVENIAVPFTWIPEKAGEKRLTLKVKPQTGELVTSNNEYSTYVNVLKGGLNALFIQGPHSAWEAKFWLRATLSSPDINGELKVLRRRDERGAGLTDDLFAQGRFDAYVLSDLPADFLTDKQRSMLARAVKNGAGLIMLGGRTSFGSGGWAGSELADVLPIKMRPGDGQLEPEGGIKFTPNSRTLDSFLLQIGPTRAESARIWTLLPPLTGINRLEPKDNGKIFGVGPGARPEPIMIGMDVGSGRSLAFGGETWIWARSRDAEGPAAHHKFWRQVIFWLCHKEDSGADDVKIALDSRRLPVGQKLDFGVTARDAKGSVLTGLKYETKIDKEVAGPSDKPFTEPVDNLFDNGETVRGSYTAKNVEPAEYRVSVVASKDGKEIGRDSARFVVYEDDRELENPAADLGLLRQVADASGGQSIPPEQLTKYLKSLEGRVAFESLSQTERKIWDNWPFLLIFATLLTLEWWIRKRHGWV